MFIVKNSLTLFCLDTLTVYKPDTVVQDPTLSNIIDAQGNVTMCSKQVTMPLGELVNSALLWLYGINTNKYVLLLLCYYL